MSARNRHDAKAGRRHERGRTRRYQFPPRVPLPGWTEPEPGELTCTATVVSMTDVNTPEAIKAAQKWSHDNLILELGDRRRSGVSWKVVEPPDVSRALDVYFGLTEERLDLHDHVDEDNQAAHRAWLVEHPDAVFVIAMAAAAVPS